MANLSNLNNKFIVTDEGKVGIGITAPTGILHTDQTFSGYAPVTFKNSVTNQGQFVELITSTDEGSKYTGIESKSLQTGNGWKIWGGGNNFGEMYLSVSGAHAIVIKNDLKVGIGTDSPDLKLHVDGVNAYPATSGTTPNGMLHLRAKTAGGSHGLYMGVANASPWGSWLQAADAGNLATEYPLLLNPNGGNVGIGTFSPGSRLTVNKTKSGTGVENYDLIRLGLLGTGAVGDSSTIGWFSTSGTKTAGIEGISGLDNILYGELAFHVRRYTTDSYDRVMTINNRGNVGIGTTLPTYKLHVSDTSIDTLLRVENSSTNKYPHISIKASAKEYHIGVGGASAVAGYANNLYFYDNTAAAIRMTIHTGGNVGIGTATNINAPLTVQSNGSANTINLIGRQNGIYDESVIGFYENDGTTRKGYIANSGGNMYFAQGNGLENLAILSGGNVGIGTGTPTHKLHVYSAAPTGGIGLKVESGNATNWIQNKCTAGSWQIGSTGSGFQLYNDNTASYRFTVQNGGKVGIGTTSPAALLDVNEASGATLIRLSNSDATLVDAGDVQARVLFAGRYYSGSGTQNVTSEIRQIKNNADGYGGGAEMAFLTNDTERMRITSVGYTKMSNTGSYAGVTGAYHELRSNATSNTCAVTNTNAQGNGFYMELVPNNKSQYLIYGYMASANRFVVWSDGDVQNINNSYGAISDVKLKENIVDATPKLDDLMKVKIRNYNLIGEKQKQIGVVAQELEQIFPSLVDEKDDFEKNKNGEEINLGTKTKSVKYSVFVPMLIKAIQELKAEIELLKNK